MVGLLAQPSGNDSIIRIHVVSAKVVWFRFSAIVAYNGISFEMLTTNPK
jgi:hypothetical protein